MADTRLLWGAEALWSALHPLLPGLSVEVVASLPSTNTTLLERARATGGAQASGGEPAMVRRSVESGAFGRRAVDWQPCLLVAEEQTSGRGRMGREWHAQPLASLCFSLALPLAPADWSACRWRWGWPWPRPSIRRARQAPTPHRPQMAE